jgi:hypothetical protein
MREGLGDNVVLSRDVPYAFRQTWDKCSLLPEGVGDGLVVGEDDEVAPFQHMEEMLYGLIDGQ